MQNKRPVGWWVSVPKIVNGKVLCVAIDQSGEETTSFFTLEELQSHLTQRAPELSTCTCKVFMPSGESTSPICRFCGKPPIR